MRLGWRQRVGDCCACFWTSEGVFLCLIQVLSSLGHVLENHNVFMNRDIRNSQVEVL